LFLKQGQGQSIYNIKIMFYNSESTFNLEEKKEMNGDAVFVSVFMLIVIFVIGPLSFKKHKFESLREKAEQKKITEERLHNQNKEMKEEEEKK